MFCDVHPGEMVPTAKSQATLQLWISKQLRIEKQTTNQQEQQQNNSSWRFTGSSHFTYHVVGELRLFSNPQATRPLICPLKTQNLAKEAPPRWYITWTMKAIAVSARNFSGLVKK